MSNWLTWKFRQKNASHLCFLLSVYEVLEYAVKHLHHVGGVHGRQVKKKT